MGVAFQHRVCWFYEESLVAGLPVIWCSSTPTLSLLHEACSTKRVRWKASQRRRVRKARVAAMVEEEEEEEELGGEGTHRVRALES